jgi:hypothetical protein
VFKPILPLYKLPTWLLNKQRKRMLRQLRPLGKEKEWFSTLDHNQLTQHQQAVAVF